MIKVKKDVFGINGLLHRDFGDGYEFRESQVNMSVAAAKAILNRDILLAEGATGVGKSFAYLIAAVSPFLRQALVEKDLDAPIVISTSTKVLQDQIWEKDVPAILKATGQDLRVVLAKGRNNYASARRLHDFVRDVADDTFAFATAEDAATGLRLAPALAQWIQTTDGEFADFDETLPLSIRLDIESTNLDCHGKACKFYEQCPYHRARAERPSADIIVVNHALLALHIAHNSVLPKECNTFIIDEAHKFFDAASSVFEVEVKLSQVDWFLKTFRTRLAKLQKWVPPKTSRRRRLDATIQAFESRKSRDFAMAVDFFTDAFEAVEKRNGGANRFGYAVLTPILKPSELVSMLSEYAGACKTLAEDFGVNVYVPDEDPLDLSLSILYKSAVEIRERLEAVTCLEDPKSWCYWSDVVPKTAVKDFPYRLSLKRTPIDISEQIAPLYEPEHAIIFTSATLQVAGNFSRIHQQLGLNELRKGGVKDESQSPEKQVTEKVYRSPFPFQKNVEIHLFSNTILDRPYDLEAKDAYMQQQTRLVEYYIRLRDGRALVLCTSQQFLVELSDALAPILQEMGIQALRQFGTDKLKQTLKTFKADERSVLFGVASCWEGLDAPGPTLETVIIPQLPFAPPHPLLDARRALLENPDRDWFYQISLPDMLLHLKQGAGRLIRCMTDKGVIAVLSPRPLTKSYGRDILKALPPGQIIENPGAALYFLKTQQQSEVDR